MSNVRHILGISGGKDSAALSIYMKNKYPNLDIEYFNSDTGCELSETELLITRLETYLGGITMLRAAKGSPEPTPFEHFLKANGNFLPAPQSRWCTIKMKLMEMEKFVGNTPTISYVGIRGDEDRDGYVSSKPNIQAIYPFRRNIWSVDVITKALADSNIPVMEDLYRTCCPDSLLDECLQIVRTPLSKTFSQQRKLNALLDIDVKLFNRVVFGYLKTTEYPVGQLDEFPLVDNDDIIIKEDVFRILEESGVGVPAYYNPIEFEVDGKKGTYSRSRSGCYFCFFQQKLEWVWLLEQHPDLYRKAMGFEKNGYTWNQGESLEELARPDRVRQIKLDAIQRQDAAQKVVSTRLVDRFHDNEEEDFTDIFK